MSTRDLVCVALALVVGGGCASGGVTPSAMEGPNLGREATPAQNAGWDISVGRDGAGLPPGKGTPAMGATVYEQKAPVRTIGSYWPYATTVFDYVRRSMPYIQPQSLSDNEVYAVTAYLLNLNGIIGENDEMNAQTLPKVKMPNQPNFIVVYPSRGK